MTDEVQQLQDVEETKAGEPPRPPTVGGMMEPKPEPMAAPRPTALVPAYTNNNPPQALIGRSQDPGIKKGAVADQEEWSNFNGCSCCCTPSGDMMAMPQFEMSGSAKCAKILMFGMNIILWFFSLVIIGLGIWGAVGGARIANIFDNTMYRDSANILIAVGIFVFFLTFLGCCGAIKEVKWMLILYFVVVLILFLVLLGGCIAGLVFRNQLPQTFMQSMANGMWYYNPLNPQALTTRAWDDTQQMLRCCGVTNPQMDWMMYNNRTFSMFGAKVPQSCCDWNKQTGQQYPCMMNPVLGMVYVQGCYNSVMQIVQQYAGAFAGVGILVAFLMLIGMIFSMILFKQLNDSPSAA